MSWITIALWLLNNAPHLISDIEKIIASFEHGSPFLTVIKQDLELLIQNGDIEAIAKAVGIDTKKGIVPSPGDTVEKT